VGSVCRCFKLRGDIVYRIKMKKSMSNVWAHIWSTRICAQAHNDSGSATHHRPGHLVATVAHVNYVASFGSHYRLKQQRLSMLFSVLCCSLHSPIFTWQLPVMTVITASDQVRCCRTCRVELTYSFYPEHQLACCFCRQLKTYLFSTPDWLPYLCSLHCVYSVLSVRRCWAPVEWRHKLLWWWWWWWWCVVVSW